MRLAAAARDLGSELCLQSPNVPHSSMHRSTSAYAPLRSSELSRTSATLFSMSSADQPRLWPMNGNCGKEKPSSPKNIIIWPTTAWTLSCPPITKKAATLFRISTRSWIVIWF